MELIKELYDTYNQEYGIKFESSEKGDLREKLINKYCGDDKSAYLDFEGSLAELCCLVEYDGFKMGFTAAMQLKKELEVKEND